MTMGGAKKTWLPALAGGLCVTALGTAIAPFGWALVPGMLLSWLLFPAGVRGAAAGGPFAAVFFGSLLAWTGVILVLLLLVGASKGRRESDAAR